MISLKIAAIIFLRLFKLLVLTFERVLILVLWHHLHLCNLRFNHIESPTMLDVDRIVMARHFFMSHLVATSPMLHQHQIGNWHVAESKNKTKQNHMDQEQNMYKLQGPKDINFSFQLQLLDIQYF